jgi:endoglycosylceramidase
MYTVVDFHQDVYAERLCGDGFPDWTIPAPQPAPRSGCPSWGGEYLSDADVQTAFDRFWAQGSPVMTAYGKLWDMMAMRYASRPGVIGFEPINEPGWGTADMDTFEATTLTTFYGTIAARLQASAPDALVFFDGTGIDGVTLMTSLGLPSGSGLVFAPHYYQASALGGSTPVMSRVQSDIHQWQELGAKWNVPVFLGEFGAPNPIPDVQAYLSAHYDALDALAVNGTQWEYSTSTELWNSEDLSLCAADGTENPQAKAILRPYARAVAGSAITFSFDASSSTATLTYAPTAGGVTEVAVPARAYPSGYAVEITGGCADSSQAGRLLVQADASAEMVKVTIAPK